MPSLYLQLGLKPLRKSSTSSTSSLHSIWTNIKLIHSKKVLQITDAFQIEIKSSLFALCISFCGWCNKEQQAWRLEIKESIVSIWRTWIWISISGAKAVCQSGRIYLRSSRGKFISSLTQLPVAVRSPWLVTLLSSVGPYDHTVFLSSCVKPLTASLI